MQSIHFLKRKEISTYDLEDIWTADDIAIFLKYCPSKRDRCFIAMAHDTGCRPQELLKLRINEITFKQSPEGALYAIIAVNSGKTGQRTLPLFDSIPYIKEWIASHPSSDNDNAYLFISMAPRSFGNRLDTHAIRQALQKTHKRQYFPHLLDDPEVPPQDKARIRMALTRRWNPYTQRHTTLTKVSKGMLVGPKLNQYAGWSFNSKMPSIYLHYFNNESANDILQQRGVIPKTDTEDIAKLAPKPCPHCNIGNNPTAKFCHSCKSPMTIQGYEEAKDEGSSLKKQLDEIRREIDEWKSKKR